MFILEKKFLSQRIIQALIAIAATTTIAPILSILANDPLHFCFTHQCFSNLLIYFNLPIKLLISWIAIFTILLSIYRSEIQAEQLNTSLKSIKSSESQNALFNFYKHREEFTKLSDIKLYENQVVIPSTNNLHNKLFPAARNGTFDFCEKTLEETKSTIIELGGLTQTIYSNPPRDVYEECMYKISILLANLFKIYLASPVQIHHYAETGKLYHVIKILSGKQFDYFTLVITMTHLIIVILTFEPQKGHRAKLVQDILSESTKITDVNFRSTKFPKESLDFSNFLLDKG